MDAQVVAAAREADQASKAGGGEGTALQAHAAEVKELSEELKKVADRLRSIDLEEDTAEGVLEELQGEKTLVNQQIEIGGGRGAFAQMLVEQQRNLPNLPKSQITPWSVGSQ